MLGRGNHRSAPSEDRVLANRHIHAANQQLLMDHILKFSLSFLLLCQVGPFYWRWNSTGSKFTLRVAQGRWLLVRRPISCASERWRCGNATSCQLFQRRGTPCAALCLSCARRPEGIILLWQGT